MKGLFTLWIGFFWVNVPTPHTVLPYPDNSLEVADYQTLGMPSPDDIWGATEYKRAVKVVSGYYAVDKWSIPRSGSPYSGALFSRMTNIQNFEVLQNKDIFLRERLEAHDDLTRAVGTLQAIYTEPQQGEQRFGAEALRLFLFSAQTVPYSAALVHELKMAMLESGVKNGDLDKFEAETQTLIFKAFLQLLDLIETDATKYDYRDLQDFAKGTTDWGVRIKGSFSEAQRREIKQKAQQIMATTRDKSIRKEMKRLRRSV